MTARKKRRPPRLRARSKVWLERDGEPVFGDGKADLLETIDEAGSLRAASDALEISYRALWGRLRGMEQRLGVTLVARTAGGAGGGSAQLTPDGRELLDQYRRFRDGLNEIVDERFGEVFGRRRGRSH